MRILNLLATAALLILLLQGCTTVRVYQRANLGDPIMERADVFAKQTLEQKFFSTREGSIGGAAGIGGGCGCAK
jgi:ABC-type molybdate transport system substrate-binding protein